MAEKWTKTRYDKLCKDVKADLEGDDMNRDEVVYDVAKELLHNNKGLKEFMEKEMKVRDCVGRLASDI